MKKLPEITYSDWMEAMGIVDKVPPGWKTRQDIQKEIGRGKDCVLLWIRNNPDKVEMKYFVVEKNGYNRVIPHYKLKESIR